MRTMHFERPLFGDVTRYGIMNSPAKCSGFRRTDLSNSWRRQTAARPQDCGSCSFAITDYLAVRDELLSAADVREVEAA